MRRVELRHLRYFVAVAEERHFGRAADRLRISPPTLSQQIRALERRVGAPLLVRHPRGVDLTPVGRVLLDGARETLRRADDALLAARQAAGLAEPVLRQGLLNGVPPALPAWLEQVLVAVAPAARTVLLGGTTTDQLRRLAAGELDLALVRCPVAAPAGTRVHRIAREELGVLMSSGHHWAGRASLDPAELADVELVLFPRELAPGFHDALVAAVRDLAGAVRLSASAVGHAQLRTTLPLRAAAVSLSSTRGAAGTDLVWRPLDARPLWVSYALAWRSDNRNPALRDLIVELDRQAARFRPKRAPVERGGLLVGYSRSAAPPTGL
ncbi:LysR family transcriptional regulator [Frankia sp. QA3]|uniref:LysR family transcriptional regulator n=1 Tax=Frankia sp. QA3 TaxID=710111 RepID=UPI000269C884|nr:LysR family transcriptional regulator [Frankia sp. QA3]EIV94160.1 transcriptional regulator [Frankia sp. QA3]